VIDEPTRDRLQECVRRESRSLFQYVREVPVWVSPPDRPTLDKMRAMALDEQAATDDLGRRLQKLRIGVAVMGPYPGSFTTVNDAALHYVLPKLVREQRAAVETLETDLAHVTEPDVRALLERMLGLKRQHSPELEALHVTSATLGGLPNS
jgi:hypothetical protein